MVLKMARDGALKKWEEKKVEKNVHHFVYAEWKRIFGFEEWGETIMDNQNFLQYNEEFCRLCKQNSFLVTFSDCRTSMYEFSNRRLALRQKQFPEGMRIRQSTLRRSDVTEITITKACTQRLFQSEAKGTQWLLWRLRQFGKSEGKWWWGQELTNTWNGRHIEDISAACCSGGVMGLLRKNCGNTARRKNSRNVMKCDRKYGSSLRHDGGV